MTVADKREGKDTIKLERGRYRLELPAVSGGNRDGDLSSFDDLVIEGTGPKSIIDGNGKSRVLALSASAVLRDLTVTGGTGRSIASEPGVGGAIYAQSAELRMTDVIVKGSGTSIDGGGLYLYDSDVKLDRVDVRDNEAAGDGGGIYAWASDISIKRSTMSGNEASGLGGGLGLGTSPPSSAGDTVEVLASTVSGNQAAIGGGVSLDGQTSPGRTVPPVATFENSTIADNRALVSGGGASAINNSTLALEHATVAYNLGDSDHQGGGAGGGLHQSTGATIQVLDSLVAENELSFNPSQCSGTIGGSRNVAEQPSGCPATDFADVGIFELAANGGPTKTVELRKTSPANGATDECPDEDQRGKKRPKNGCDVGAYEREPK